MTKLINHWYWGRAQAGAYSIVASYITARANYGNTEIPIFMLAKDGAVVADDPGKVRFSLEGEQVDEHSGKPFAQVHPLWVPDSRLCHATSAYSWKTPPIRSTR